MCGFAVSNLTEQFFLEGMRDSGFQTVNETGERNADMLQNRIIPSLTDKNTESTTFMQDGAAPHIFRQVKYLLPGSFGVDRVLNYQFCHAWPLRSPDLNRCDYWLWGYLKSQITAID